MSVVLYEQVDKDLMIDINNLNGELMDQAMFMRQWTRASATVNRKVKAIANKLKHTKAQHNSVFSKRGMRAADIDYEITLQPDVQKLTEELIEAEYELEVTQGIVRAFVQKHDALKDLSANVRKEIRD